MAGGDVFPAETPDELSSAIVPLDADTAERLLSGRLDPDDAPPGYAEVARLLQAAAAPPDQAELAGQAAAMDAFRTAHPRRALQVSRPAQGAGRRAREVGRPAGSTGGRGGARGRRAAGSGRAPGARGRLVALALAGALALGGMGVWTAGGAPFSRELGSPSGGPGAGGRGSGTPGSGAGGSGAYGSGAAGSLRPAWPGPGPAPADASVRDGRPPILPRPANGRPRGTAAA